MVISRPASRQRRKNSIANSFVISSSQLSLNKKIFSYSLDLNADQMTILVQIHSNPDRNKIAQKECHLSKLPPELRLNIAHFLLSKDYLTFVSDESYSSLISSPLGIAVYDEYTSQRDCSDELHRIMQNHSTFQKVWKLTVHPPHHVSPNRLRKPES